MSTVLYPTCSPFTTIDHHSSHNKLYSINEFPNLPSTADTASTTARTTRVIPSNSGMISILSQRNPSHPMMGKKTNNPSYSNAVRSSVQPGERSTRGPRGRTRKANHTSDGYCVRANASKSNYYQQHRFQPTGTAFQMIIAIVKMQIQKIYRTTRHMLSISLGRLDLDKAKTSFITWLTQTLMLSIGIIKLCKMIWYTVIIPRVMTPQIMYANVHVAFSLVGST